MAHEVEVRHTSEVGGGNSVQDPEGGTKSVARKRYTTKSGYLTFKPGEISTINWRMLYQDLESNKAYRGETNKSTKSILEIPQETCPDKCQVEVPSAFQSVFQVSSQMNIKEGTQLKCQRNLQVPGQGPHQLIFQIESIRDPRGFPRDIPSIMPVRYPNKEPISDIWFGYSSGYLSRSPSYKPTKHPYPVPIIKPSSGTSENPTKHPSHVPK